MLEEAIREAIQNKEIEIRDVVKKKLLLVEERRKLQEELEFVLYGLKPGMRVLNSWGTEYELERYGKYGWDARKVKKDGGLYAVGTTVYGNRVTIKPTE